jgi:hypothetical protein
MLLLSIVLGTVPLIGIAWTAINGSLTTVDGLFLTLILLSLSGILFLNGYLEIRKKLAAHAAPAAKEQK